MKFKCSVEIDLPQEIVFTLYSAAEHLVKWQTGFESRILLTGESGTKGSKSKLTYLSNKSRIELIETVIVFDKPNLIEALYEHRHMVNSMKSSFTYLNPELTRIEVDIHYTKFIGFIPKIMSLIIPGLFKKQVQNRLKDFREFTQKYKY